jgi:hypothetical protein
MPVLAELRIPPSDLELKLQPRLSTDDRQPTRRKAARVAVIRAKQVEIRERMPAARSPKDPEF